MYIVYIDIRIYTQWDVTPLFFEISPRSPPAMHPSWDALLPMTWPRNLPMALSLLSITASAPSRMALATSHASAPRRRSHWENLRTLHFKNVEAFQHFKISGPWQWKIPHWVWFHENFQWFHYFMAMSFYPVTGGEWLVLHGGQHLCGAHGILPCGLQCGVAMAMCFCNSQKAYKSLEKGGKKMCPTFPGFQLFLSIWGLLFCVVKIVFSI